MNIPLNEKEYSELIRLIYWAVLELSLIHISEPTRR